jgi:hypothetical protein
MLSAPPVAPSLAALPPVPSPLAAPPPVTSPLATPPARSSGNHEPHTLSTRPCPALLLLVVRRGTRPPPWPPYRPSIHAALPKVPTLCPLRWHLRQATLNPMPSAPPDTSPLATPPPVTPRLATPPPVTSPLATPPPVTSPLATPPARSSGNPEPHTLSTSLRVDKFSVTRGLSVHVSELTAVRFKRPAFLPLRGNARQLRILVDRSSGASTGPNSRLTRVIFVIYNPPLFRLSTFVGQVG